MNSNRLSTATLAGLLDAHTFQALSSMPLPIRTIEDLLTRDSIAVAQELKLSMQELSSIKLEAMRRILSSGAQTTIPIVSDRSAWKALPSAIPPLNAEARALRSTGIVPLDTMFGGGLPAGSLVSVVGGASSGKSTVAVTSAAACALLGMRVEVVTSSNDINVKRVQMALETLIRQNQDPAKPYTQANFQDLLLFALANITVHHCFDLWALLDLLAAVRDRAVPDLLVIDCLHHYLAPLLSTVSGGGAVAASVTRTNSVNPTISTCATATVPPATAAQTGATEMLNSLLCQVTLLLRNLTSLHCTVMVTNTPASTSLLRRNSTVTGNGNSGGGGNGGGGSSAAGSGEGLGMGAALLDCVDICLVLERVATTSREVAAASRRVSSVLGEGSSNAPTSSPTTLRAVALLRPPYLKACPTQCEFTIA